MATNLFGTKIDEMQHDGLRIETHIGSKGRGLLIYEQPGGPWPTETELRAVIASNSELEKFLRSKGKAPDGGAWTFAARCYVGDEKRTFDLEIGPIFFTGQKDPDKDRLLDQMQVMLAQGLSLIDKLTQASTAALAQVTQAGTAALAQVAQAGQQTLTQTASSLSDITRAVTDATTAANSAYQGQVAQVKSLQEEVGGEKFMTAALTAFAPLVVDKLRAIPDKPEKAIPPVGQA